MSNEWTYKLGIYGFASLAMIKEDPSLRHFVFCLSRLTFIQDCPYTLLYSFELDRLLVFLFFFSYLWNWFMKITPDWLIFSHRILDRSCHCLQFLYMYRDKVWKINSVCYTVFFCYVFTYANVFTVVTSQPWCLQLSFHIRYVWYGLRREFCQL